MVAECVACCDGFILEKEAGKKTKECCALCQEVNEIHGTLLCNIRQADQLLLRLILRRDRQGECLGHPWILTS